MGEFSLLNTIDAENEAMKYCRTCQTAKSANGFRGEICEDCQQEKVIVVVPDPQEASCFRNATLALIRAHRAEFDHLLGTERQRIRSTWSPNDGLSWADADKRRR